MADETTTETTAADETAIEQNDGDTTEQAQSDSGELERIRAALKNANKEAEKHRLRAKELEDATKSDEDKRSERFAELEQSDREKESTITTLQATILRYEVAAAKGLDLKAAGRLRGNTKEEIEADADEFAKEFGTPQPSGPKSSAFSRVNQDGGAAAEAAPGIGRLRAAYSN